MADLIEGRKPDPDAGPDGPRGYLRTPRAAAYLDLSVRALAAMRAEGRGPRYHRHGGTIFYAVADLDAWVTGGAK